MLTMRLTFSYLLLFLVLGPCFKSTDSQETTTNTDAILPTSQNNFTVETTLSPEITTPENTITLAQTETDLDTSETTLVNQVSTMQEPTSESTQPLSAEIEQTSQISVPETTTVQTEQTTVTTPTVYVNVETTATEQITSDAPSTSHYETTVAFTELTIPAERPTDEITTATVAMTTESTVALNPTSILAESTADWTDPPSIISSPADTSTTSLTPTSQLPQNTAAPMHPLTTLDEESVSTYFTSIIPAINDSRATPIETNWILIIIVCVAVIFLLCVGMILFVHWRKKNASRNFRPQSKWSKKKKGGENDAWAGPVNLEAGAENDAEVQEGLLPNNGKSDGDDMVLSTFTTPDGGDMANGGVGGDGTKEAKKWEEQEPFKFIDEDVNEDKTTLAENEKQKGDEKSEEKGMNGGETFCLTTAV
ncbi:uncharacterized protein si:ch73-248e21.7 [Carassius carassius]|uniref:uncharacterized protein si:ch73-248e21.7 n=1 Tax=Carassius carassius TaxID=217509 RepID=UPI002868C70B|nr:uncharacterized protein si:ch73-248e21.7 [Carassius carassius]